MWRPKYLPFHALAIALAALAGYSIGRHACTVEADIIESGPGIVIRISDFSYEYGDSWRVDYRVPNGVRNTVFYGTPLNEIKKWGVLNGMATAISFAGTKGELLFVDSEGVWFADIELNIIHKGVIKRTIPMRIPLRRR